MTLSDLHHLLCHLHRLACGRQILSKTRAREFHSKLTRKSKARISRAVISPRCSLLRQHVLPSSVVGRLHKTNSRNGFGWISMVRSTSPRMRCSVSLLIRVHTRLFTTAPKATEIVQRDTLGAVTYGRLGKFLRCNRDRIIKQGTGVEVATSNLLWARGLKTFNLQDVILFTEKFTLAKNIY